MPEADLRHAVIRGARHAINAIGAPITALGGVEAAWRFARLRLAGSESVTFGTQRIREHLGLHLLLTREIEEARRVLEDGAPEEQRVYFPSRTPPSASKVQSGTQTTSQT